MKFGDTARAAGQAIKAMWLALALAVLPQAALAAAPAAEASPATAEAAAPAAAAPAAAAPAAAPTPAAPVVVPDEPRFKIAPGGYTPMKPTPGKGQPVAKGTGFQDQYSPDGLYARDVHDNLLLWIIGVIAVFVLFLLLYVMIRFNKRMNPVPSKTSHNTLIEIVWTVVPIIILVVVFVPSMKLLGRQFEGAPKDALTIEVTGNQWFWTYKYPDNGGFEVVSNMLSDEEAKKRGEPEHLAADNRIVVPVGEPIRMQVSAADVIHAFAVPSLWFKIDAVPGRTNERVLFVNEPGVYYGQCSELCGARHGYMPITLEALPRDKYNAWVIAQGGTLDGLPEPEPAPAAPAASAAPAAAASPAAAPASPAASASPASGN